MSFLFQNTYFSIIIDAPINSLVAFFRLLMYELQFFTIGLLSKLLLVFYNFFLFLFIFFLSFLLYFTTVYSVLVSLAVGWTTANTFSQICCTVDSLLGDLKILLYYIEYHLVSRSLAASHDVKRDKKINSHNNNK